MSVQINPSSCTRVHILLVEDDPLVQIIHREKLERLGCIVDSATTGTQALEKSKKKYDLILLDWGLPDINGIEVCRRVREHEQKNQLPRVPIAMITAYPRTVETQQECLDAGVDTIVGKPIVEDQTWEKLVKRQFSFIN